MTWYFGIDWGKDIEDCGAHNLHRVAYSGHNNSIKYNHAETIDKDIIFEADEQFGLFMFLQHEIMYKPIPAELAWAIIKDEIVNLSGYAPKLLDDIRDASYYF